MSAFSNDQAGLIIPGEEPYKPDRYDPDPIRGPWLIPNPTPPREFKPFDDGGPFVPKYHPSWHSAPPNWPGQGPPIKEPMYYDNNLFAVDPVPYVPSEHFRRQGLPGLLLGGRTTRGQGGRTTPTGRRPA